MKRLVPLFILALCFLLYAFSVRERAASNTSEQPNGALLSSSMQGKAVVYKTQALQLVSTEPLVHPGAQRVSQSARLSLRNVHQKTITAFVVSIGSLEVIKDFARSTLDGIAPAAVEQLDLPISSNHAPEEQQITILAAVFGDGSSDGEPDRVAIIQAERSGYRKQLSRILPLLQGVIADYPEADDRHLLEETLDGLIIRVSSLPESPENGLPPNSRLHAAERDGLRAAKEQIIRQILQFKEQLADLSLSPPLLREMLKIDEARRAKILQKLQGGAK